MKSGMIVELPKLGEVQVIGDVVRGEFVDIWGIGVSKTHKTIMNPSGKLKMDIMTACKRKDLEVSYEQAKKVYLDSAERLEFIAEISKKIEQESLEICE